MKRLTFDENGKLESVDGSVVFKTAKKDLSKGVIRPEEIFDFSGLDASSDSQYWSLYKGRDKLEPLKFSNGKNQEDVVKEVIELIKKGNKIIFLHGMCGTGKSAIALNIARVLGKTSIVVPVKNLQRQYIDDYTGGMYVLKKNGENLKIQSIIGRDNYDSIFKPGVSCSDQLLPDTIQINEKNRHIIKNYYEMNPLVKNKDIDDIKKLKRISIAPANPYWSPIIPADYEAQLKDAVKKRYTGLGGREFIFYHRKHGCGYYDQYQGYINSDVIIFNSAKYKIEVSLDRKPETEVDIIDEADEFLDSFSNQSEVNLTRLNNSLKHIISDDDEVMAILDTVKELVSLEEKRISALGIEKDKIYHIKDTNLGKILSLLLKNRNVESEISLDETNYANRCIEAAKQFNDFFEDTYLTYWRHEDNLYANFVTTNLSKKLNEILAKNKAFVFMSGTLHSKAVLENVFGIKDYKIVSAETEHQGEIDIIRTGRENDCSYKNFASGGTTREDYLIALSSCIEKAEKPFLVHVNSFEDLPSAIESEKFGIYNIMTRERLNELQTDDKTGRAVALFKQGLSDVLYSTKCSRGVDFPGDICRAMIFTKYPNPNVRGTFWKVLERTHPSYFWDFYKDKARREFLQRIYRALRFKDDHVFVLSPDSRALDAVRELQTEKV